MPNSRSAKIKVSEMEYELLLTTRATKEIAARYGGLDNLGDKLMKGENFEQAIDEIIWLITLLANQPILIHNYRNAITPEASCEARGDYRSLDTAAPDDAGNVWPTLPEELTFELVQTPDGSPTAIRTFSGIVSVEYDTRENKSTISISGCAASY